MSQFYGQNQYGNFGGSQGGSGFNGQNQYGNFGGSQGGSGFNNPYQKRRSQQAPAFSRGGFGPDIEALLGDRRRMSPENISGGFFDNILPTNSYPRMPSPYLPRPPRFPSPYPMPSPYPGGGNFGPIRGGGMGQVRPTNMPFRDPGYGSPVRTQNLISAMSGPQDLMSDRRMGSLNMLDQLRNRTESPSLFGYNRYGSERNNYQNMLGGGGYNPIRTADFQDRNRNGVDDRDEGGGGMGGFFGGGYGSGMGRRDGGYGNLGGPGGPANPYAPPPRLNETAYGVDEIGNALTEDSYNYILNNSGVDADGDGKINSEEFDAYSNTEDAKNYMPGELPEQLKRIVAPEDTLYGTRYDGKAFTDANFGRFTNPDKDGVGSADRDNDSKISEDEWLDWMLSKGATEGYEKDWTTKITGALASGVKSGTIDSKTKAAAVRALKQTQEGDYNPDYNIETGETRQEIKDRWARQDAEKAKEAEKSGNVYSENVDDVKEKTKDALNQNGSQETPAAGNNDARAAMIAAGVDPDMMDQILAGNFNFGFAGGGPVQARSSMEDLIAMAMQGTKSNMPQNMLNSGLKSPSSGGQGIERLMRNLQARKLQQSR